VNSFAEKMEKPTTDEYLKVGLEEVLDRLNKNPNGLQSEAEFVSAVITVRYAIITEKLNRRLVCLTGIVAIATVLLVAVPFITPSL
jgi:gamma-glutamylcysteine synthetase